MQHARTTDADSDKIFAALREMKPNRLAMERLVHRLRRLPAVVRAGIGAEGRGVVIVLRNVCETVTRTEAADLFSECALLFTRVCAAATGVWAGSFDETPPEPEWGASVTPSVGFPTFSARTFLSPNEMKPAVWLRWQPDPTLSAA
ncbi:MAG: hypothetical protein COW55_08005 [Rhodobacteraceae bacterium CG17_big_fil_post_rev_8_21_14_2_50_65_11]|nr:MAG: hypothetical protein COW55_08005 [Rhodobacteraceae bacterium CG17_big_fil_post_rev_8_21_14_2_50_65_11]